MDISRILEIQTQRGAKTIVSDLNTRTIDWVITDCRKYIQDNYESYKDLDSRGKREAIKDLILAYVMSSNFIVEGYKDEDNNLDTNKLVDKLVEDITDRGILTQAILDESVYEIRVNGKEIKIEQGGRNKDLRDKDGNIISFDSVEQQEIVIRKLLGDVRLTPKDALVNARTVEGFRIAAVHNSALSPDPLNPMEEKYHAFVLRKFNLLKLTLEDIVKFKTMSDNMARFLSLLTAADIPFFTVGPTGSGKTTTNNAILQEVPVDVRTVIAQNPSEIDIRKRDSSGRIINDVLHIEAREIIEPTPNDPTMQNIMNHVLRLTPKLVALGEIRTNAEFKLALQIGQAGHPVNLTYHASNSAGAVRRYLTAYLAESGNEPSHLALENIVDVLDIVIVQKVMRDGTRKILQISEVVGIDPNNRDRALINDLYKFEITEDAELDEAGNVINIIGEHKRVGKLSDRLIEKFKMEGVRKSQYDFLINDPSIDEVETYTGENISNYGKF